VIGQRDAVAAKMLRDQLAEAARRIRDWRPVGLLQTKAASDTVVPGEQDAIGVVQRPTEIR
jgi:hypothetical protein